MRIRIMSFLRLMMELFLHVTGTCWLIIAVSCTSTSPVLSSSSSSSISSTTASLTLTTSRSSDITFNINKLHELGSRGQWLLRHMAMLTHKCGFKDTPSLKRKLLRKSNVTCNDGSPAGWVVLCPCLRSLSHRLKSLVDHNIKCTFFFLYRFFKHYTKHCIINTSVMFMLEME